MDVYLDNAASTKPSAAILEVLPDFLCHSYGNPSALHQKGLDVEEKVTESKTVIANCLGVSPDEIYFTSGGTESNNIILQGVAHRGRPLLYTQSQHASIVAPLQQCSNALVVSAPHGAVDIQQLLAQIHEQTALVCLSHVNNESGTIESLVEIGQQIKLKNPRTLFHVDGVQGFGKISLKLKEAKVDSYSYSAHKIHGLKGIGGLYVRKGVSITPLFYGGNQQKKLRPGTENTLGIFAFMLAAQEAYAHLAENATQVAQRKTELLEITKILPDCIVNGALGRCSPYLLNLSFLGIRGELLLNALSARHIYVATASACTGKSMSENLLAHGYSKDLVQSAIRFSFSKHTTKEEIEYCLTVLEEEVKKLRRVVK